MYWKVALMQHPMYLIIKEDSVCAERTPPWGEPTIERYIGRVRENLAALRRYPQLKVGYEWSGLELELLAQEGPGVLAEMCALAQEGRVAFYNGTYAQPHLHTLSSEANYRQFEYGMKVYRDLCGQVVLTYAHQESSVHDQVPQLLRAFGIEFATLPSFYCTLAWLDEGELAIRGGSDLHFVHGHEFVCWHGLDGSEINLYLNQGRGSTRPKDWWALHGTVDQLHAPPITIEAPDMLALDEAWLAEREQADFVLLDQALPERLAQCPPQAQARLYANWSYIEGIRAEELSRSNWRAEAAALQAEALNALAFTLLKRPADPSEAAWKPILASQHHDVYCFSAPELRQKGIDWRAADVIGAARSFGTEPVVCLADARKGRLPASSRLLAFTDSRVTVTAVKVEGSQVLCRLFAGTGDPDSATVEAQGLRTVELRSLAREQVGGLDPFQIAELILEPTA